MDDQTNQNSGFLVKKADGTTVRLSLDEIKKRAKKKNDDVEEEAEELEDENEIIQTDEETATESIAEPPAVSEPEQPQPTEKPVPHIIRQRQATQTEKEKSASWSKSDHASPLEEELVSHEVKRADEIKHAQVGGQDYSKIVDEIMQDIPFSIPANRQMRTRQLLQSFLRGIRDKHSFRELAVKSPADSGLGLSDQDAARLIVVAMDKKQGHEKQLKKQVKIAPKNMRSMTVPMNSMPAPAKASAAPGPKAATKSITEPKTRPFFGSLATTTPVPNYFEDVARFKMGKSMNVRAKKMGDMENKVNDAIQQPPRTFSRSMEKQIMHDLRPPSTESRAMGPVEEMQNFELTDLRRLSNDPVRAGEKVVEKLKGWQQESYLLYMDARNGWFRSPLYKQYQSIIKQTISENTKLEDFLRASSPKDALTLAEIRAMVEINKQLTV